MNYDSLFVGSGGTKGYALLGALSCLRLDFKNLIGVSVGSIILFLLSIGYNINDISKVLIKSKFTESTYFKNAKEDNLLLNFINYKGFNNANDIMDIVKLFLKEKNLKEYITFDELYKYNNYHYIVIASNINKNRLEYFSYKETPNISVLFAIRASISIPILFSPIKYKNDYLVDGAFFNFIPIKYITNKTILINLDGDSNIIKSNITKEDNLKNYILLLFNGLIQYCWIKNNKDIQHNIVNIEVNTTSINFELNKENKLIMFNEGLIRCRRFIKEKNLLFNCFKALQQHLDHQ